MEAYFRVNLDEGVLRKEIYGSGINADITWEGLSQVFLVGIGDKSWCAVSKKWLISSIETRHEIELLSPTPESIA